MEKAKKKINTAGAIGQKTPMLTGKAMEEVTEKAPIATRIAIKRARIAQTIVPIAFIIPAIYLAIVILFHDGIGLDLPRQLSVIWSMVFFYLSMVLCYLSMAMLYKGDYDSFVTYMSLSTLFWYASFGVYPFMYPLDTLVFHSDSIINSLLISSLFSISGLMLLMFLYKFRLLYEERKSLVILVVATGLLAIFFSLSILYLALYHGKIHISKALLIPTLSLYIAISIALVLFALILNADRMLNIFSFVLYGILIALTISLMAIGLTSSDYVSRRSYLIGGMYALFSLLSNILIIIAFLKVSKWNRLLSSEEAKQSVPSTKQEELIKHPNKPKEALKAKQAMRKQ